PATTNGVAPVTTTCTPQSGSSFPVGTNSVTCSARDAVQQTAECTFNVSVTAPPPQAPLILYTKFLAFGDSITEGKTAAGLLALNPICLNPTDNTNPTGSYPAVLRNLLSQRYTTQTITVAQYGCGGEFVSDGADRLPIILTSQTPQVLLLQEGAN